MPMEPVQVAALVDIEFYYHRYGRWPKPSQIKATEEGFDLEKALGNEYFLKGLSNRGIPLPSQTDLHGLTNEQITAILIAVDYTSGATLRARLKNAGISIQTWNGWMKNPEFKQYVHSLSTRNFEDSLHVSQESLLKAVERGDVNAIKYYNELTGRSAPVEQNARVIIHKLIQIIQTHVRDEATLNAIARDIQTVLAGGEPSPREIEVVI